MGECAKKVVFTGRVQGVGFRYAVRELAKGFMVVGSVENLCDGNVAMIAQGEEDEVGEFLTEIMEESEVSHHIKNALTEAMDHDPQRTGFKIISGNDK